ncbi:hypothetical protein F2P81_008135 [Scophthalmus maximus]|uniref:Uncharacterized protein n=1 Tax=Scophthalmus maximus TaxID=52904 RepID=A0A6A4T7C7_SCOMX|nr:hypothetical protein F2P81_008135 [Scophthalmus maximus]
MGVSPAAVDSETWHPAGGERKGTGSSHSFPLASTRAAVLSSASVSFALTKRHVRPISAAPRGTGVYDSSRYDVNASPGQGPMRQPPAAGSSSVCRGNVSR